MNNDNIISTSILKGKAIYGDLLLSQGYKKYQIEDLAINEFLDYEAEKTGEATDLYLLSIKKILLYAIPIISPINTVSKRGVSLTAQFNTEAIIYYEKNPIIKKLAIGDKYILLGFSFSSKLINNLDFTTFELKYFRKYPDGYLLNKLDISYLNEIDTIKKNNLTLHFIKSSFYEDVNLYNKILHLIKNKLNEYTNIWTSILYQIDNKNHIEKEEFYDIIRIEPLNNNNFIKKLNLILEKQIDITFTASYYEILHSTANWLLYDQIYLYGYESNLVMEYLKKLTYIKSENTKVLLKLSDEEQNNLLQTRAEKITRDRYPFYFSSIDNRGIFTKFNRFNINRLTPAHQKEIKILLQKDLDYQNALINNNCNHIEILKELNLTSDLLIYDIITNFNKLLPYIDTNANLDDNYYHCKKCKYIILCEHEFEFYSELKINYNNESKTDTDTDILYNVQQIIINRYKNTQAFLDKSNIFSYSCKYCSKELGKSDDIIQVAHKDKNFNKQVLDTDIYKNISFLTLSKVLNTYIDPSVLNLNKKNLLKSLIPIIRDHLENISYSFKKLNNEELIESHIKLSALILSLCAMIVINVNILKSNKQLLIDNDDTKNSDFKITKDKKLNGGSIKSEFSAAFDIIKKSAQYKVLVISDDKIKTLLLDYYRRIAKDIVNFTDTTTVSKSNEYKLTQEIIQSPVYSYLQYIYARNNKLSVKSNNEKFMNFKDVMGIEIKKDTKGNLYNNIIEIKTKINNDQDKYISESYNNIRNFLVNTEYNGIEIEKDISNFVKNYELEKSKIIYNLIKNPKYYLSDTNQREVIFELTNLNLIYCDNQKVLTKHNFIKEKCSICGITLDKVSEKSNSSIEQLINTEISIDAFFDLYLNNCPIKDIHVYEEGNNKCLQCDVSKKQLLEHDLTYYKQYLSKFEEYKKNKLIKSLNNYNSIIKTDEYIKDDSKLLDSINYEDLDAKINQIILTISKLFEIDSKDLQQLDNNYLDSYIKLVYERYSYASNISYDMNKHPDIEYFDFVKELFMVKNKITKIDMKLLPAYDFKAYDNKIKLYHLLTLFNFMIETNEIIIIKLGKFILNKIISQEKRRKDFNFAKLKSIGINAIIDENEDTVLDEDIEDEDDEDITFMAYDIDIDDIEDNIEGDLD